MNYIKSRTNSFVLLNNKLPLNPTRLPFAAICLQPIVLFTYKQIFIAQLSCVRHCSKYKKYSNEKTYILVELGKKGDIQ